MRMKSLILGTLLGGLTALVWSNISWELIGWHEKSLLTFQQDPEVAAVISSHTMKDGTYLMPFGTSKQTQDRMQKGPIVFASVRRGGLGSVGRLFGVQIAILFAIASGHGDLVCKGAAELRDIALVDARSDWGARV